MVSREEHQPAVDDGGGVFDVGELSWDSPDDKVVKQSTSERMVGGLDVAAALPAATARHVAAAAEQKARPAAPAAAAAATAEQKAGAEELQKARAAGRMRIEALRRDEDRANARAQQQQHLAAQAAAQPAPVGAAAVAPAPAAITMTVAAAAAAEADYFTEGEEATCRCGQRLKASARCSVLVCQNCKQQCAAPSATAVLFAALLEKRKQISVRAHQHPSGILSDDALRALSESPDRDGLPPSMENSGRVASFR